MGYNMMDNMVDSVFVSVLGLNFPLLTETSLFSRLLVTVIVLILNITINTTGKSCSIFFSPFVLSRFFLNVKCLLDIFWDSTPPPPQSKIKWSVPIMTLLMLSHLLQGCSNR